MEEVRQLVQEEGREARNLVAFHVSVDTAPRVSRKPPRSVAVPARRAAPRSAARLRSASAGRDKRSELRARYWALLFGDLQRAIGEIYNTVEAHENMNECQEVILVLENYTRDFKALGEWFRLKWEYDNTPPPQRPQSLAWEIRKTDFVRPESRRAFSVKTSPTVSGKNSPSLSGHNTPSGKNSPVAGKVSPGSGKISPRIVAHTSTSPKANIEFFSNKIASKLATKPEVKVAKETRLSEIKEKVFQGDVNEHDTLPENTVDGNSDKIDTIPLIVEIGKAKETSNICPKHVVIKSPKREAQNIKTEITSQAKATIDKLDAMESEFLARQLVENASKNDNMFNQDKDMVHGDSTEECIPEKSEGKTSSSELQDTTSESPIKSDDNFADVSNESSLSNSCNEKQSQSAEIIISIKTVEETPDIKLKKEDLTHDTKEKTNIADDDKNSDTVRETVERSSTAEESGKQVSKSTDEQNTLTIVNTVDNQDSKKDADLHSIDEGILAQENNKLLEESSDKGNVEIEDLKKNDHLVEETTDENDKKMIKELSAGEEGKKEESKKKDECMKDIDQKSNAAETKKTLKDLSEREENKKTESKTIPDAKINSRPAYSQAAAKPKPVSAKVESKTSIRSVTTISRSKNVVETPSNVPKARQFPKKNQISKCSYPFNLTTSRTSLFESSSSAVKPPTKKPLTRNGQVGSGDTKNIPNKVDPKKRPQRPSTLKINEKGDKKEKANPKLEKIKDCDEYSSSDTIVTQIDLSRIESSESLKTLVPEEMQLDVTNSVEVLNVDGNKNDNEGWLTVKSRRLSRESKKQSKSHWANRFHQPSATTSLPTLNMISPRQETSPVVGKDPKFDRAVSEQPEKRKLDEEKPPVKFKALKCEDPTMIRQKSDVTGLKSHSAKHKINKKSEKVKNESQNESDLTINRLHSSLESLTTGLARSQESTENAFDFDKWKAEFKSTFKFLDEDDQVSNDNEILKSADPSEMSEIAEMTVQIEENERKICLALDFQTDVDQRKLCEEEDLLNRQIMELQQVSDIDLDTETDDTETDAEILCEDSGPGPESGPGVTCVSPERLGELAATLEDQYETALAGMSWAERVDTLVALQALVARDPGRAQQLHAKLSQGIKRRGSLQDALRRLQAKQARAERQRREYQTERAKKIHQLLARVEEVKIAKNQLIEEKRLRMERRLQKAAENRDQHLKDIVRKAHDEEEKLREILFIKQLEAENRRHELLDHCRTTTQRLRAVRRDRLNKLQEKAAREAAVGLRRAALEAARQAHVRSMLERRRQTDLRREQMRQQRHKERGDAAREKAEGVKSRLSALAAAAQLEAVALRSRIRDKQDASQQRLESRLQAIREKATQPRLPTTSESHEQGSKEEKEMQDEAERQENERKERDRLRNVKKKARRVRQKLLATSTEILTGNENAQIEQNPVTNKFYKVVHQLNSILIPLLENENNDNGNNGKNQDNENDEVERNNKKNKKSNKVNGIENEVTERKKSKKKKGGEDKIDEIKENLDNLSNKKEHLKADANGDNTDDMNIKLIENIPEDSKENPDSNAEIRAESNISILTGSGKSENKKKKKKNKNKDVERDKVDRPKLSKASSICSSLSEASKASCRMECRATGQIDVTHLERHLNELNRMMDKLDKGGTAAGFTLAARCAANVIEIAAAGDLLPVRCVSRAISLLSRGEAAAALRARIVVHAITVLADLMERDLQAEVKEAEVARQVCEWVTVCLQAAAREGSDQAALRARAHTVISYLCLSGCISRIENAGEVRDSIHRLLTVCIDLCQPSHLDVGGERSSALQSLRGALVGAVSLARGELCALLAGRSGREPAAATLLRAAAELDHRIVQEAFGEGGWPLEFRAAVARLLAQHAPTDREAPRTDHRERGSSEAQERSISERMVLDLIVLVGFVVVNNPQLQETICDGWSVLKTLCTLPANWLVSQPYCHALLPTLAALADRHSASAAIAAEMSMQLLEEYLESPEAQKVKLVQVIKQGRSKKTSTKK